MQNIPNFKYATFLFVFRVSNGDGMPQKTFWHNWTRDTKIDLKYTQIAWTTFKMLRNWVLVYVDYSGRRNFTFSDYNSNIMINFNLVGNLI